MLFPVGQIRSQVTQETAGIHLNCAHVHKPVIIDQTLELDLQLLFNENIKKVVSVDHSSSESSNSIFLFIELSTNSFSTEVFSKRKHLLLVESVYFLEQGTMDCYTSETHVRRFTLRDDVFTTKLGSKVLSEITPNDAEDISCGDIEDAEQCTTCFSYNMPKPLHLSSFDIVPEWHFDVPLETQMFLENFINKKHLKVEENNAALKKKITRLYALYDLLLNTYNKKYFGIHQQANTEEISLQYRSLKTVLEVTANSGITTGKSTADKRLNEKSEPELCYYGTFTNI